MFRAPSWDTTRNPSIRAPSTINQRSSTKAEREAYFKTLHCVCQYESSGRQRTPGGRDRSALSPIGQNRGGHN
jgi:hypothetical protein